MTSVKTAAAIAVVAVIVIAVGAFAVLNGGGGGNGSDSPVDAIGTDVQQGDYYILSSVYSSGQPTTLGADASEQTRYEVASVQEDLLTVNVTPSTGSQYTETMSKEDYLDDVRITQDFIGQYQRTETISTGMGNVECMIYFDEQSVGNSTVVYTYDWIGKDSNVIYKTEITVTSGTSSETFTTTLAGTNLIDRGVSGDGSYIPDQPSSSGDDLRTDLQEGDYIQYVKYDDDDRDRETYTVVRVDGDRVLVRENGDDDADWMSASDFIKLVKYDGSGRQIGTETIQTDFGTMDCTIYTYMRYYDDMLDLDDGAVVWVGGDGVIYKLESLDDYYDDDDWDDRYDRESYYLTGTSLFNAGSGGGSTPTPDPDPADNRFGVELTVGDYYVIRDDDGRFDERYEIIAIDGSRLTVMEEDGDWDKEIERMSANEFLSKVLITSSQLDSAYESTGEVDTVNGIDCQVYRERCDDDRERICVQQVSGTSNYIIWEKYEDWDDTDTLIDIHIQSSPSLQAP